jgi:hypothetical protein
MEYWSFIGWIIILFVHIQTGTVLEEEVLLILFSYTTDPDICEEIVVRNMSSYSS